jgi:hypothetical protein
MVMRINMGAYRRHIGDGAALGQHYAMPHGNLVYTGVPRGKRLVVQLGQHQALAIAVKAKQTRRRWSKLREWLAQRAPLSSEGHDR